ELRFAFFQVNTPAVTWKLARIPLEKLPAVNLRVREFEKDAFDPITGKVVVDPRTGFDKQFQTELLIDAFNLPVVASGTTESASGDGKKQRDIRWKSPKGEALSGTYLLEASATLGDGRIIGNRSIICRSDFILTQKRTPTKVIMRVTKMSDAQSVVGMTVRAVTNENIEIARASTDATGIAIPTATDAQWRVMEGDGGRVIGEGNVALSSYGGWEAEWNVPEKAKLGHYIIDCRVSGKDYDGSTRISIEEYRVPLFSVVV